MGFHLQKLKENGYLIIPMNAYYAQSTVEELSSISKRLCKEINQEIQSELVSSSFKQDARDRYLIANHLGGFYLAYDGEYDLQCNRCDGYDRILCKWSRDESLDSVADKITDAIWDEFEIDQFISVFKNREDDFCLENVHSMLLLVNKLLELFDGEILKKTCSKIQDRLDGVFCEQLEKQE